MKCVMVADALLPKENFERVMDQLEGIADEIVLLTWGGENEADVDQRARRLELEGPLADEPPAALYEHIGDADMLIFHYCPIPAKLLEMAHNLKILGVCRAGYENVDVKAATERGIVFFHVMGRTTEAVSDFTVGLILCEIRNIARGHMAMAGGTWRKDYSNKGASIELENKTIGLIGFGEVGRAVARKLSGFAVKIMAYDPYAEPEAVKKLGVNPAKLEEILREADIVSLHARLTPENEGLIGERELSLMKPTAYLINSARGGLVDEDALYKALRDKKIAGAALDVYHEEPLAADHPFRKLDNITLCPHLASSTVECVQKSPRLLLANILGFLKEGQLKGMVNTEVLGKPELRLKCKGGI